MNKTEAIKKINTVGKVGSVICLIAKILLIIVSVFVLIGTITMFVLPANFVSVNTNTEVTTVVDITKFASNMSAQDEAQIQASLDAAAKQDQAHLSVNDVPVNKVTYDKDSKTITVVSGPTAANIDCKSVRSMLIVACIGIAFVLVSVFFTSSLCKAFSKCESPFEENIIIKIRNLAISLIPMAIFSSISNGYVAGLASGGKNFNYTINFAFFFAILLILAISYIFKYGAQLQKESDETL